jgi:hypothetical protein
LNSAELEARAEAMFRKREQDRKNAKAEYEAAAEAQRRRTADLRALRLSRDAARKGG